jgi:hypothetical protein
MADFHPAAWIALAAAVLERRAGRGLCRRVGRRLIGGSVIRVPVAPAGLRVDLRHADPAAAAPRAADGLGRAAEVRDHLAASATGHTLPRLMGVLRVILVVCLLARHGAMRLAVPA